MVTNPIELFIFVLYENQGTYCFLINNEISEYIAMKYHITLI